MSACAWLLCEHSLEFSSLLCLPTVITPGLRLVTHRVPQPVPTALVETDSGGRSIAGHTASLIVVD